MKVNEPNPKAQAGKRAAGGYRIVSFPKGRITQISGMQSGSITYQRQPARSGWPDTAKRDGAVLGDCRPSVEVNNVYGTGNPVQGLYGRRRQHTEQQAQNGQEWGESMCHTHRSIPEGTRSKYLILARRLATCPWRQEILSPP